MRRRCLAIAGVAMGLLLLALAKGAYAEALSVEDCIHLALRRNPYVQQYRSGISAARPLKWEAFSGFLPQVYIEDSLSRTGFEGVSPYYRQESEVVMSYNLFAGGKTLNSLKEAEREIGASEQRYRQAVVETAYRVAEAFYTLVEKKEMVKAARDDLKDAQTNLGLARAQFKQGLSPYADVIKAKAGVANARYKLTQRLKEYYVAQGELNKEIGNPVMENVETTGGFGNETRDTPTDFEGLARQGLSSNPQIAELRENLKAEINRKRKVYSEFLPSLDFNWHYGWQDTSFPPNDYNQWEWTLTLKIPLFSGFASRARLARERAMVESMEYELEWEKRKVTQEIWRAFQELKAAKANVEQSKAYLDSALEDLQITQGRYKEGLSNMVDLITSQASLSLARAKYISSQASLKRAMVALEKAMGKVPVLERAEAW